MCTLAGKETSDVCDPSVGGHEHGTFQTATKGFVQGSCVIDTQSVRFVLNLPWVGSLPKFLSGL